MTSSLVILDTETATLLGAPHLLELGAVRVVEGEIQDQFESLVRPEVEIESGAAEIHGIRQEDVREAPTAEEVLASFREWAGEDILVAHNARADATVLGYEYARLGMRPPGGAFVDSLRLARECIPESIDHKLETLCQHLDLEEGPRHRALSDAVYCWMVLAECVERLGGSGVVGAHELLARCGSPLTIESATPAPPRSKPRLRGIELALAEEAEIVLLYGEASEQPVRLSVTPRFLYQRRKIGYLEAICSRSGSLKTYRLDRVHRVLPSAQPSR